MENQVLKYYMFDWDDNILHMATPIHIIQDGVKRSITSSQFAKMRNKPNWVIDENGLDEFGDNGLRGTNSFIEDIKLSLESQSFGPCWHTFIHTLISAELFLIVTARGHSSKILKESIHYIIENVLSDSERRLMEYNIMYFLGLFRENKPPKCCLIEKYLDYCMYMGINSDEFKEISEGIELTSEKKKEFVIQHFITKLNELNKQLGYQFTIGFSDDDKGNIKQIKNYLSSNNDWENVVGLYIYDTSNPKKIKKTVAYKKTNDSEIPSE